MINKLSHEGILQSLFDSIPAHITIKDLDGRCVLNNHHHEEQVSSTSCCSCSFSCYREHEKDHHLNDLVDISLSSSGGRRKGHHARHHYHHHHHHHPINISFPLKDAGGHIIGSCDFDLSSSSTECSSNSVATEDSTLVAEIDPSLPEHHHEEEEEDEEDGFNTFNRPRKTQKEETEEDHEEEDEGSSMISYHNLMQHIETGISFNELVTNESDEPIDYIFCDVNPAFEKFLGLNAQDCIGKRVTEVLPGIEGDQADWIKLFGRVAITGVTERFMQYSEKLENWYSGIAYQTDAKKRRFACLFTEVSDQVHYKEALREIEEQHGNLFQTIMQGVVYQDASGNIIDANPAAERILGLTLSQMMGRTSVDPRWKSIREDGSCFPGNEHPSMEALQTGKSVTNVIMGVYHPQSQQNRWIRIDAVPRFKPGEEDKPFQVYTTFTDITEKKQWDDDMLRAKEKAEESDNLKSSFLANMSHEIRTPLNGIMGHIDLALSNGLSDEYRNENLEGLNIAKASGRLLLEIIQDILDLSKISAGQLVVHDSEPFSIKETLAHTQSLAQTIIKSKNKDIQFVCSVEAGVGDVILGDPFRLQQVINNLTSNAIKFTSKGSVLLQVSQVDQETIQFSVLDTGKGIPSTHLETIFQPFRQVEISDTRQHGGTGLGLTISQKLVNMMGGEMRLESSILGPMRGSFFAFTLPYRPGKLQPRVEQIPVAPPVRNESPREERKADHCPPKTKKEKFRILVAEDDPVSRKLVARMLQRTGYDVCLACDGEEAVSAYTSNKCTSGNSVALVLMDCQMPRCDGHEATRKIREHEKFHGEKPVPIIALSAGAMKCEKEQGLSSGMTDYLTKPVDFKCLVQTLERHLEQANPAA